MKAVQPIRDMELLYKCLDIAHEHDRKRKTGEVSWELLLVVGFNTSLRISDIRRFRVRDLRGQDYAEIKAQKTGKEAKILINPHARRDINRLLAGRSGDEYILQSKQRGPDHKPRPITRQRAYQIINEIARKAGIKDHIGCHTLRKTFGYFHYKRYKDVALLQQLFNHASPSITLRYIGITQDEIDDTLADFFL